MSGKQDGERIRAGIRRQVLAHPLAPGWSRQAAQLLQESASSAADGAYELCPSIKNTVRTKGGSVGKDALKKLTCFLNAKVSNVQY